VGAIGDDPNMDRGRGVSLGVMTDATRHHFVDLSVAVQAL